LFLSIFFLNLLAGVAPYLLTKSYYSFRVFVVLLLALGEIQEKREEHRRRKQSKDEGTSSGTCWHGIGSA